MNKHIEHYIQLCEKYYPLCGCSCEVETNNKQKTAKICNAKFGFIEHILSIFKMQTNKEIFKFRRSTSFQAHAMVFLQFVYGSVATSKSFLHEGVELVKLRVQNHRKVQSQIFTL